MSTIPPVTDADFEATVLKAEQPVVVDFWAEWCAPCRQIAPVLEELANEYAGKISFVKMDTDANPKTPIDYRVSGVPTIHVFSGGEVVQSIVGARPKAAIKSQILDAAGLSA